MRVLSGFKFCGSQTKFLSNVGSLRIQFACIHLNRISMQKQQLDLFDARHQINIQCSNQTFTTRFFSLQIYSMQRQFSIHYSHRSHFSPEQGNANRTSSLVM